MERQRHGWRTRLFGIALMLILVLSVFPSAAFASGAADTAVKLTEGVTHEEGQAEKTAPTFKTVIDREALPESARNFTRVRVMTSDHALELDRTGIGPYTNFSEPYNNHFYNSIVPFSGKWYVLTILYDDNETPLAYQYTSIDLQGSSSGGQTDGDGGGSSSSKVDHLEASEHDISLSTGQSAKIRIYAIFQNGTEKDITSDKKTMYRTDSASVANVAAGTVKAGKKEGNASITVSYGDKKLTIPVHVTSSSIVQLKSSLRDVTLETGELEQARLTAVYSDGSVKDVTNLALWMTEDGNVADVEKGEIEAIDTGSTTISAYYSGINVNIAVEVVEAGENDDSSLNAIVGLEASNKNIKMKTGDEKVLQIYAVYDDGSKEEVTDEILWQTSKSDVADVDEGVITAYGSGKAIITANYGSDSLQITVQVEKEKPIKSLSASTKNVTLKRGGEKEIELTAIYTDGTKADVTDRADWSSKNESIAEADAGLITANKKGATVITAKYNGKFVNISVKVK